MRRTIDLVFTGIIVVAVAWAVFQGASWLLAQLTGLELPRGWGPRAGLFPTVVGIPVLVLGLAQLVTMLRRPSTPLPEEASPPVDLAAPLAPRESEGDVPEESAAQRSVAIALAIVGFAGSIWLLGFTAAIPLVTVVYLRFAARESWRWALGLGAASGLGFYLIFVRALNVPQPTGLVLRALFG